MRINYFIGCIQICINIRRLFAMVFRELRVSKKRKKIVTFAKRCKVCCILIFFSSRWTVQVDRLFRTTLYKLASRERGSTFLIEIPSYFRVANAFRAHSWLRRTSEPSSISLRANHAPRFLWVELEIMRESKAIATLSPTDRFIDRS